MPRISISKRGAHSVPRKHSSAFEYLKAVVIAVVFMFVFTTFVAQPYVIPSASMETTIMTGDYVFGEKVSYHFGEPQAGDIVTFVDPEDSSRVLVKRVIATAGQQVDVQGGQVLVDGEYRGESYTQGETRELSGSSVQFPLTVPEGCIWVMGDNREHSWDSRGFGPVKVSSVISRVGLRYWPLSSFGIVS